MRDGPKEWRGNPWFVRCLLREGCFVDRLLAGLLAITPEGEMDVAAKLEINVS